MFLVGRRNVSDWVKLLLSYVRIILVVIFFDLELEECNEFGDVIIGDVMTG
jgi:hypothetical protein